MVNEDRIVNTAGDLRYNWTDVNAVISELMVQWG